MKYKRRRLSEEEKGGVVAGFERSGLSQREYAAKAGIGLSTLSLWRRQIGRGAKARLVEVDVTSGSAQCKSGRYRLMLPWGGSLEVELGFEVSEVRTLLEIMREFC